MRETETKRLFSNLKSKKKLYKYNALDSCFWGVFLKQKKTKRTSYTYLNIFMREYYIAI
jgi:hypothetical protein